MKTNRRAAMLSTIREAKKNYFLIKKIHGAFMDGGKQCATNGFMSIRLDSPVDGLPETSWPESTLDEYMTPKCRSYLVTLPDPSIIKRGQIVVLKIAGMEIGVNATYILRMYQALGPDLMATVSGPLEPICIHGKHGDGFIMPVKTNKR